MTAFYCFTLQELSPAVGVCYNFFVLFFFFPLWEFVLVMIWVAFQVQTLFGVPLTFYPFLVFHVGLRMHWKPHWLTTPSYDRSYYCNSRLFLNPADIYIIQNIDAPSIQFLPLIKFKVAQGENERTLDRPQTDWEGWQFMLTLSLRPNSNHQQYACA